MHRLVNTSISLTVFIALAMSSGCTSREVAKVDPQQAKQDGPRVPVNINRNVDILFVIDNSESMQEEQDELTANFPKFIDVLDNIEGGLPDVHIGVVSTDLGATDLVGNCSKESDAGDKGQLQAIARDPMGCPTPNDGRPFLEDIAIDDMGNRMQNFTGTLSEAFQCIAPLGIDGCGFEMPLEAMRRALDPANTTNQGFVRPEAILAVIIISDEDDCSTRDYAMFGNKNDTLDGPLGPLDSFRCFEFGVQCDPDDNKREPGARQNCRPRTNSMFMYDVQQRYVDFLKNDLGKNPADVIVAGIIGDPSPVGVTINNMLSPPRAVLEPSCSVPSMDPANPKTEASPSVRLKFFLDQFPARNTFTRICQDDLSGSLTLIANLLAEVIGNPCMKGDIDTDPNTAGVQEDCVVTEVTNPDFPGETQVIMNKCSAVPPAANELPCWHLEPDPNCSGANFPSGLSLVIERGGVQPMGRVFVEAACVVK